MFISGMFSEYVLGHACLVCKHSLCLVNRNNSRVLLEYSVYLSIASDFASDSPVMYLNMASVGLSSC